MMFLGLGQAFMAMATAMNFPLADAQAVPTAAPVNATATIPVWDLDVIDPLPAEYQATMPTFAMTTSLVCAVDGDLDEPATATVNQVDETALVHDSSPFSTSTTTLPLTEDEMTIPASNATAFLVNATAAPTTTTPMEADDVWNNYFDSIANWWISFFDQVYDEIILVSPNLTMAEYDNFLAFWPAAKELNVDDFVVDFNFSSWSAYYANVTDTTMNTVFTTFDSLDSVDDCFEKVSAWSSHTVDSLWNSTRQLYHDAMNLNATYSPADGNVKSVYAWASHVADSAWDATQKLYHANLARSYADATMNYLNFDQVSSWTSQAMDSAQKSSTKLYQTLPHVQHRMALEEAVKKAQEENAILEKIVREFQDELFDANVHLDRAQKEIMWAHKELFFAIIRMFCMLILGFFVGRFQYWWSNKGGAEKGQRTKSALRALVFCQRYQLQKLARRGEVNPKYFQVQACEMPDPDECLPGPFDGLWNFILSVVQWVWHPFDVFFDSIELVLFRFAQWFLRQWRKFRAANGAGNV